MKSMLVSRKCYKQRTEESILCNCGVSSSKQAKLQCPCAPKSFPSPPLSCLITASSMSVYVSLSMSLSAHPPPLPWSGTWG